MILSFPLFCTCVGKHPKGIGPDYERYSVVTLQVVPVRLLILAAIMICSQLLLMASPNIAVYSTVFSYCHNCSIAQGNRTKRSFGTAVFLVFTMFVVSWVFLIHPLHP